MQILQRGGSTVMKGMNVTAHNGRKALDRWAREGGYADFDTYLQLGGTMLGCKTDLLCRREEIDLGLMALGILPIPPVVGETALKEAEAQQTGPLPDVSDYDPAVEPNAHVQGADS